ncbi:MAG: beta-lactamase family protein [Bacteroidetes bacterium]|nr:beta-lactamase family protein [Bacteroidota bacterium]
MSGKKQGICRFFSIMCIYLLILQISIAQQRDFGGMEGLLKLQQKSLGKDLVMVIAKDGKNTYVLQTPEFNAKMAVPLEQASSWLTSAVVMTFVDAGKVSLDDKVSMYIPEFSKYFKGYITLRHCLTHLTGIEAEAAGVLRIAQKNRFENLQEEVMHYVSKRQIITNAGEAFHFSQVGPNIAARVIEVVSKKTFDRVALERLFRPCSMRTTSFYSDIGGINPATGARASAQDYINFMSMLLNKGMFNGKRVLSEASVAELVKDQTAGKPMQSALRICEGYSYSLGAWVQESDEAGNAVVLSCPGLAGAWPWLDLRRGYAAIVLPSKEPADMRRDIYEMIKQEIDDQMR